MGTTPYLLAKVTEERITARGKRDGTVRKVALYLVQRYSGLSNEEIGELFGEIHCSTVSKASARLREDMKRNKELSERVGALDSQFKT
jgi:chromosomal replication initiation ATPase DnaA